MAQSFVQVIYQCKYIYMRYQFIQARSNYMYLTITLLISCCQIQADKLSHRSKIKVKTIFQHIQYQIIVISLQFSV